MQWPTIWIKNYVKHIEKQKRHSMVYAMDKISKLKIYEYISNVLLLFVGSVSENKNSNSKRFVDGTVPTNNCSQ